MTPELASFTSQQREAIAAQGNVLVMAGAGTGKTRTLVECCVHDLLHGRANLDEILMVTFTEAAAAEMRERIRDRLELELEQSPGNLAVSEQIALLDNSMIRTLHSFCYELIRNHFYELGLDPQIKVLSDRQAYLLQEETFDDLFDEIYRRDDAEEARLLIRVFGRGRNSAVREMIRAVHIHTQTRPDPAKWFAREQARLAQPDAAQWLAWLLGGAMDLCTCWKKVIQTGAPQTPSLAELCRQLETIKSCSSERELAALLDAILAIQQSDGGGPKEKWRASLKVFFKEVAFLATLVSRKTKNPLREDWEWQRGPMSALLQLAATFATRYEAAKRTSGVIDFSDLEQYTLRLLWKDHELTDLALDLQRRFYRIFIDEYQDINPAQDQILRALEKPGGNRFMVGDVKQSIYRFRQAAPGIFQSYAAAWKKPSGEGRSLLLSENFRSREAILDFINALFGTLMTPAFGGIDYGAEGQLLLGHRELRPEFSRKQDSEPRVELMLSLDRPGEDEEAEDRTGIECEARSVALRLREIKETGTLIRDDQLNVNRPAEWSDMVVLLRAAADKVQAYAKEFDKAGVPLLTSGLGFYQSLEVTDLMNVLALVDNPFQDRPLLAVLRSPLAGLSVEDLAEIRLTLPKESFWTALNRWHELHRHETDNPCAQKTGLFLERYHRWRSLGQVASLTQRLEQIVDETHYLDWLATQTRPAQRIANVQDLLAMARQFDTLHRGSLYQFILFVEAEQELFTSPEPPSSGNENAVRLLTIHKSKGLEFPIVVIPDLNKRFNATDFNGEIILDDVYGLCSRIHPPGAGQSYPSLAFWLARKKQGAEMRHEELRLLYVAMTRAQERLILSAYCSEKKARSWSELADDFDKPHRMVLGFSPLDWLGPWFSRSAPDAGWLEQPKGNAREWCWRVIRSLPGSRLEQSEKVPPEEPIRARDLDLLHERLKWIYSFPEATRQSTKSSVTALRRKAAEELEVENWVLKGRRRHGQDSETAAEIGTAHHLFLQLASLSATSETGLRAELQRLLEASLFPAEHAAAINLEAIAHFWASPIGQEILAHKESVQQEVPFTLRLSSSSRVALEGVPEIPEGEFIILQGTVDLMVLLRKEIWIVDFKTDHVDAKSALPRAAEYDVQLRLYAHAMSKIYGRPVTRLWLHFLAAKQTVAMTIPKNDG